MLRALDLVVVKYAGLSSAPNWRGTRSHSFHRPRLIPPESPVRLLSLQQVSGGVANVQDGFGLVSEAFWALPLGRVHAHAHAVSRATTQESDSNRDLVI